MVVGLPIPPLPPDVGKIGFFPRSFVDQRAVEVFFPLTVVQVVVAATRVVALIYSNPTETSLADNNKRILKQLECPVIC